jgi:hypothetical protein
MVKGWWSHEGEPLIWSRLPMSEKDLTKKALGEAKTKYPQDFEMI